MAPSPRPSASVVICAHTERRWDQLLAAVAAVGDQDPAPLETIVVIDHNPDLFKRLVDEHLAIDVVENAEAKGLGGARNTGVARARGDVVIFLDDDAVPRPHWLAGLLDPYRAGSDVLGVGGAAEPLWAEEQPRWFPDEFRWVIGCAYTGLPTETATVRNLIGANMSIKRSVFDLVGGFTHELGRDGSSLISCEETELCIRASRHTGGRFVYNPTAVVGHHVPADRTTWRYYARRCLDEGRSKAIVARRAGTDAGLASERTYSRRVLPAAIARGVSDALRRRDPGGLARAGAIVGGFALTAAGYARGRLGQRAAQP